MDHLDTSALVMLVVAVAETDALAAWQAGRHGEAVSADLARTELLRVVRQVAPDRLERARRRSPQRRDSRRSGLTGRPPRHHRRSAIRRSCPERATGIEPARVAWEVGPGTNASIAPHPAPGSKCRLTRSGALLRVRRA